MEQTDDHILRRHGHGLAVRGLEDVVGREHEDAGLGLRLGAQRQVHSHLVTVEVSVERRADERVQLDGLTLDELRLERLDAQTVQGRCTVEQHGVFGDDLFEDIPHLRVLTLDHALGRLDVLSVVEIDQTLHHEGLEQLQRHGLGQTALVQVQLRTDDDDRTARVVHTLTEQVLTETSLLALEHVRQRLERAVARSGHRTSATTVVEQRVNGLLQHPLLVVDDDLGSTEVEQTLEAVVAVDDATVEVVEVRGREASTIELHHRAQLRRDHRDNVEDHALGVVVGGQERVDDLEALERTGLALSLAGGDEFAQLLGFAFEVEVDEALLDRLGAHGTGEVQAEAVEHLAVQALVTFEVVDLEVLEPVPHLLDTVDLTVGVLAQLVHFLLGGVAQLLLGLGGSAFGLECSEILFELLGATVDVGVTAGADLLLLDVDLVLQAGQITVTGILVDRGDHVGREVDDLLEVLRSQIQQVAQT